MFQIHPLPADPFTKLFGLSDRQLASHNVQAHISDGQFPCRVSLEDAPEGARVLLLNFEHQSGDSPYRSRHAIFVRDGAVARQPDADRLPASISSRLLSVRAFNAGHEIIEADVIDGKEAIPLIETYLANPEADYLHLHYARRGCFAAKVTRATP